MDNVAQVLLVAKKPDQQEKQAPVAPVEKIVELALKVALVQ